MHVSLGSYFKEPEGVVARWIIGLQPFDFKIVLRPGKHHSHADGLSRRTSRPCKRDKCPDFLCFFMYSTFPSPLKERKL